MKRRALLRWMAAGACAAAVPARAQAKPVRIGWLSVAPHPGIADFRAGLKDVGLEEGSKAAIVERYAQGDSTKLRDLARELGSGGADIVVASGSLAVRAAQAEIKSIPVVIVTNDVVEFGYVQSLAAPRGNITGFDLASPAVASKQCELMVELLPSATRFAAFVAGDPNGQRQFEAAARTAKRLGREMFAINTGDLQFERHVAAAHERQAHGAIFTSSPVYSANLARILATINQRPLPAIYQSYAFPRNGGLMSYGPDFNAIYRRVAFAVDQILRGRDPARMPIELPTRFILAFNRITARAQGIAVPQSILERADEIIE